MICVGTTAGGLLGGRWMMQQEHLNHDMVFDMVIGGPFIPLVDHDRVGPALADFAIHRREHILARRDTARKV
jgi:hypothetical protein